MEKIKLAISACLLGEPVRYDGAHKVDLFLRDTLGRYIEYRPVCPEVECGLPVPREPMRLEGSPTAPRLVTVRSRVDLTAQMGAWAANKLEDLETEDLCGFVFKSSSPSCGMERVAVASPDGVPGNTASGLFAGAFMNRFPLIPVEDEARLNDPAARESFFERIFVFKRWRKVAKGLEPGALIAFHSRHKLLVMAHSPKHATLLGRISAKAGELPAADLFASYLSVLVEALKLKASPARQANVLHHVMGYFKKQLSPDEKKEVLEAIELHRQSRAPLIVPVTLLNHYVRKFGQPYLKDQYYLNPHPIELLLRNHV